MNEPVGCFLFKNSTIMLIFGYRNIRIFQIRLPHFIIPARPAREHGWLTIDLPF
jgi:hypothetical protein